MSNFRRVAAAAWALVVVQVVHGAIPADTSAEGSVGFYTGIVLLLASLVAAIGATTKRAWAAPLAGWTGLVVAVGFTLYHAVPVHSPLTNPYFGEPVSALAWLGVAVSIAAGLWAAYEGLVRPRQHAQQPPVAASV
jgi:uncharacterized membrane protein YhaH (DUF805 family)